MASKSYDIPRYLGGLGRETSTHRMRSEHEIETMLNNKMMCTSLKYSCHALSSSLA